ncbi:MAG TPA: LacI family DNA-binding transcriptional regulator [Gaiellaceae bacterium]|nr:LacI family DNA-binding transcriptional regulator [Gaiellaceae bacterium]
MTEIRQHAKRATIRGVASAAGVSIATVSRVLNGRPDVAPNTREAVLRAVREQGFSTNRNARALSGGRTGLVGVTLPLVEQAYFGVILSGASEALYEQDMRVVLCPTLHQHDREVTLLDRLMRGTTDGAVLMLPEESSAELKALQRDFPFVVVDPRVALEEGIPVVSAAHAAGARAATEHLLSLGHRRIAAITGPPDWIACTERINGYHGALAAAGVMPDPALVAVSDFRNGPVTATAATKLLDLPDPPTAIFAFNDNVAIGVMRAARDRGLRVPEDLSVVGFDDSEQAEIVFPTLTTVRQPLAEMGRMAVSLLLRLLENQRVDALRIQLATKLVVRDSTAPALVRR